MKISMKLSEGSSNSHDISIEFTSGASMTFTIGGTEEAISVYKALFLAYESGLNDEANFTILRRVREQSA